MATALPRSPLAPECFPDLPPVAGVAFATAYAGGRYVGRDDLLFVTCAPGTTAACLTTRSTTAAAPVLWCRTALAQGGGRGRALVVNAGNANAFTGTRGVAAVETTVRAAAERVGDVPETVFVASTGVIGQYLDGAALAGALPLLTPQADWGWEKAAAAIMTTDTFPKGAGQPVDLGSETGQIVGIAKGSGMIMPDMATMLGFLFTDVAVAPALLQQALTRANAKSFNCVTVDGDTSTSDTVVLFATGQTIAQPITEENDPRFPVFLLALEAVMADLAQQVARDGEGAQKFVTVTVRGAADPTQAHQAAMAVANSPLVKTAIAGGDPNWGRLVMAVGKAGVALDAARLRIGICGFPVTEGDGLVPGYDEAPVAAAMQGREITLEIDLGVGSGEAQVWTCDLTHGYIEINADYRS